MKNVGKLNFFFTGPNTHRSVRSIRNGLEVFLTNTDERLDLFVQARVQLNTSFVINRSLRGVTPFWAQIFLDKL